MAKARIGLACAGGVVEGAFYEIGALSALEEAIPELDIGALDYYVGVSSGALVATFLASGIPVRQMAGAVAGEPGAPMILRPELLLRPDWSEFARRLAKAPGAVWATIRNQLDKPGDLSLFGATASLSGLLPVGLFDNRPLERFVASVLAEQGAANSFDDLGTELRIVAMDIDSSDIVCFGDPELRDVPVSRAVQASTALPVMYRPVKIGDRYYIDGVARRTVHASRALEAGMELVICVNPIVPVRLQANGGDHPDHLGEAGLPHVLSQTFRTMVHSRMNTGFRTYRHRYPEADTLLIEPSLDEGSLFFSNIFSFSNRRTVCEEAYASTRSWLASNADQIGPMLARHGLTLDLRILAEKRRLFSKFATPMSEADETLNRLESALATIRDGEY